MRGKLKQRLSEEVKRSLMIGVDIGSENHHAVMRHPDGRESKVFKVSNTVEGLQELWEKGQSCREQWSLPSITIGMESTGSWSEPLGAYFEELGATVVQVNGAHTKKYKDLLDNSPLKSDLKDPRVIAELMSLGHVLTFVRLDGVYGELRDLNTMRENLMEQRVRTINVIKNLLACYFPEFESVAGDVKSKSAQYLLSNGWHEPGKLLEADVEELGSKLKKISRGQKDEKTIEALREKRGDSVGLRKVTKASGLNIQKCSKSLTSLDEEIAECEKVMRCHLKEVSYAEHLFSIKGVGLITVSAIAGEIGDFSRFSTIGEVEKYFGLNLYEISSGRFRGVKRLSKRGRGYLRKILYLTMLSLVRCHPDFKKLYDGMKSRGKNSKSAFVALSRKLLRVCFGLVKYGEDYDSEKSRTVRNSKAA